MPTKSQAQSKFMQIAANNPAFAKKAGVPVEVAREFNLADKRNVTMNKIANRRNRQLKKGVF